eukprot:749197-Hanusia_phi.AAC.1
MGTNDELLLKLEVSDALRDFDMVESVIRDHIIPVSLSSGPGVFPELGIQPSFTLMNREYISMKMMMTRWLRKSNFIMDGRIDLTNGVYIKYFTVYEESDSGDDRVRLFVEIRMNELEKFEDDRLLNRKRAREEKDEDGYE